jgi:hypothetical protein
MKIISELKITESGGDLIRFHTISDGQLLKRVGDDIVGYTIPSGHVIQSTTKKETSLSTLSAQISFTDSVPQITDGTQIISDTITPSSSASKIKIRCVIPVSTDYETPVCAALFKNSESDALAVAAQDIPSHNSFNSIVLEHYDSPQSTSVTTYIVRIGSDEACTITINGINGARLFGGKMGVTLTLEELK